MQTKDELKAYCDLIRSELNSKYSDAMYQVFMPWLEAMPNNNYGLINSDNFFKQGYLLSFTENADISFSIPTILDNLSKGLLNTSRGVVGSKESIVFSAEYIAPLADDYASILAVEFPVSVKDLLNTKPYIIDGNKRISQAMQKGFLGAVSYILIEPHSFDSFCFTDFYSRFILLFTYDMVMVIKNEDHEHVLSVVSGVVRRLADGYPSFFDALKNSASLL
ncbi:MAG: hypothetical protein IJH62_05250 [Mogibacterium sp.]|nr:hypothetical protein [Mogibacterium sp.]